MNLPPQTKGILWAVPLVPFDCLPIYSNQPATPHITLKHDVSILEVQHWVGVEFEAIATAECFDYWNHAIAIALPMHIPCQNEHPHLTVSWKMGSTAKASNEMLAGLHRRQVMGKSIRCRIEFEFFKL